MWRQWMNGSHFMQKSALNTIWIVWMRRWVSFCSLIVRNPESRIWLSFRFECNAGCSIAVNPRENADAVDRLAVHVVVENVQNTGLAQRYIYIWSQFVWAHVPGSPPTLLPISAFSLPERDTISTTLSFLLLQNANDIKILNRTEQFLHTMIAFLGKENTFLDADVSLMLNKFVRDTFTDPNSFDFDAILNRKLLFCSLIKTVISRTRMTKLHILCRKVQLWKPVHFISGSIPRLQLRRQDVRCNGDGAVGAKAQHQMAAHAVVGACARSAICGMHRRGSKRSAPMTDGGN